MFMALAKHGKPSTNFLFEKKVKIEPIISYVPIRAVTL
jgi:hypothetical protein